MFSNNQSRINTEAILIDRLIGVDFSRKYSEEELIYHMLNSIKNEDGSCGINAMLKAEFGKDFRDLSESELVELLGNVLNDKII